MSLPEYAVAALEAVEKVVKAGELVRDTGGDKAACDAYDAIIAEENAAYEAMNDKGMTREQWAEYDRKKVKLYRKASFV